MNQEFTPIMPRSWRYLEHEVPILALGSAIPSRGVGRLRKHIWYIRCMFI